MWSPPYLKRQWCIFELASFLAAPGDRTLALAPLYLEMLAVVGFVTTWLGGIAVQIGKLIGINFYVVLPLVIVTITSCGNHLLRKQLQEKACFLAEMKAFNVDACQCRKECDSNYIDDAIVI